jgi:transposase-like protein
VLVQRRRDDSRAALRLMRKLLKEQGFAPRLLVTDKLRSYASAFRRLRLTCPHEQGLRGNNRAENSHQAGAATRAQFNLHHDGDEVAYVLSGEVTFMIGDEVTVGGAGT